MLGSRSTVLRLFRAPFYHLVTARQALNKTKNQTVDNSTVWQLKQLAVSQIYLRSFDNFAGFNAACADLHPPVAAGGQLDANRLKIRVEPPSRFVIGVRYVISKLRAFPAYVAAFCHIIASRYLREIKEFIKTRNKIYNKCIDV